MPRRSGDSGVAVVVETLGALRLLLRRSLSGSELAAALDVHYRTGYRLLHRLREAGFQLKRADGYPARYRADEESVARVLGMVGRRRTTRGGSR